ncbi:MAG: FtsX-like permease family protein [Gemmatimonadetes bacterium]|nr:FtsX-like permease family protein [Gemmatimonadota bacterium]
MLRRVASCLILLTVLWTGHAAAQRIGIAIEQRLADASGLSVGDTLSVSSPNGGARRAAVVAAIVEPRADPATILRKEYRVRFHLADLAELLGQPDRIDRAAILLQPGVNPDTARVLLGRTAFGYELHGTADLASSSSTTFLVVSRFHRAIAIISVLASAIFLLCLMLLKVDARRQDVAMLRFIGISRRTVFIALLLEAGVIAAVGGVLGIGIAAIASAAVNAFYQQTFATTLIFSLLTWRTILEAALLGLVLGLGAGALAAWRLVRLPPLVLWGRAG